MWEEEVVMEGIRERCEGDPVYLASNEDDGYFYIQALNECGYNCTEVNLADVI